MSSLLCSVLSLVVQGTNYKIYYKKVKEVDEMIYSNSEPE